MPDPQPLDPQQQRVVDQIAGFGWMVMQVSPEALSEGPKEWYAFTVGLPQAFGWPELICFNLDQGVMHHILNNAVNELRAGKLTPKPGLILKQTANAMQMKLLTLPDQDWKPRMRWSTWYAETVKPAPGGVRCLQLVWPDKAGRFPGDPRCDKAVAADQTPLQFSPSTPGEVRW